MRFCNPASSLVRPSTLRYLKQFPASAPPRYGHTRVSKVFCQKETIPAVPSKKRANPGVLHTPRTTAPPGGRMGRVGGGPPRVGATKAAFEKLVPKRGFRRCCRVVDRHPCPPCFFRFSRFRRNRICPAVMDVGPFEERPFQLPEIPVELDAVVQLQPPPS